MEIELLPSSPDASSVPEAEVVWFADQPSPFGDDPPRPYRAILLHEASRPGNSAGTHRYRAELVTGKDGPQGALQLLALIERRAGMSAHEALRHWDEHIPLAVAIHHKALRYRQFRFVEKLTATGPDYLGFAVLDFEGPGDLRTGLFRNAEDVKVINADVAEFIGRSDIMYGNEHT